MATTAPPSRAPPAAPNSNPNPRSNPTSTSGRSAHLAQAVERDNQSREPQQSFRPSSTWSATTGNHEVIWNGQESVPPPLPTKGLGLEGYRSHSKDVSTMLSGGENEMENEDERFSDAASWEGTPSATQISQGENSSSNYQSQRISKNQNSSNTNYQDEPLIRQSTYGHARNSSVGSSIWAGKGVSSNSNSYSNSRSQKDGSFQFPPPLPTMPQQHSNSKLHADSQNYNLNSPMLSPGLESDYSSYDDDRRMQADMEEDEEERYSNPNGTDTDWMGASGIAGGSGLGKSTLDETLDGSTPEIHSIENFQDETIGEDGFEMIPKEQSASSPTTALEAAEGADAFNSDLPSSSTITTDLNGKRFMPDGTPIPNLPPIPNQQGPNSSSSPSIGSGAFPSRSGSNGQRRGKGRRNRSPILSYADGAEAEEALFAQQQQAAMSNGISLDEDEVIDEEGRRGPRLKKNSPAPWELDGDDDRSNGVTSPTSPGFGLEKKLRSTSSNSNDNPSSTFPTSGSGGGVGAKFRGAAAKIDSGRRSTDSSRATFSFGRDKEKSKESSNLSNHNYQSSNSIDDFGAAQRSSTSTDHQVSSGAGGGTSAKPGLFSSARARSKSVSGGMLKGLGLGSGSNNPPPLPPDVIAINPNPPSSSSASVHSSSGKKSKLAKAFRRADDDHHNPSKKNISLAAGISSADYFPAGDDTEKDLDSKDSRKTSNTSNFNSNLVNPFGPSPQQQPSAQSHPPSPYSFSSATSEINLPPTSPGSAPSNLPLPSSSQPTQSLSPMIGNNSVSSHSSAANSHQGQQNPVRSSSPNPVLEQGGSRTSGTSSTEGVAAPAIAGAGASSATHSEKNHVERELLLSGGKYISPTRSRFGGGSSPNPGSSPLHSPSPSSPIGPVGGGSTFANQQQRSASRTGSNVSYKRSSTFFDDRSTPPIRHASTNSNSHSQASNESTHLPHPHPSNSIPKSPPASHPPIGENQSISSLQGDGFGGYVNPNSPHPPQNQTLPSSTSISSTAGGGSVAPNLGISNSGSFPRPGEGAPYKLISLEQARQNQLRQQQSAQQQALASAKERKEKARLEKLNKTNESNLTSSGQPSSNQEDASPVRPNLVSPNSADTIVQSGKQLKNKKSGFLRIFNKEKDQSSSENQPPIPRNDDESADNVSSMPTFSSSNARSLSSGNVPSIETDNASSSGHGHPGKIEAPALKTLRPMSSMFSGFGSDLLDPSSLAEPSNAISSGLLAPTSPALTSRSFESGNGSRASSGLYEDAQASNGSGIEHSPQMTSSSNLNLNPSSSSSSSMATSSSSLSNPKSRQSNQPPKSISTPSYSTSLPGPVPPLSTSSLKSETHPNSPRNGRNTSLDTGSHTSISEGHSNFASPLTSPVPISNSNDDPSASGSQSFASQQQAKLKERSGGHEPKERLRRLAKKEVHSPSPGNNDAGNRISTASSNHSEGSSLGLVNGFPATPSLSPGVNSVNGPPSPAWRNRVIEIEAQILELTSELTKMRMEFQPESKVNSTHPGEINPSNVMNSSGEEETLLDSSQSASQTIPPCHSCGCTCADQRRQQAINEAAILKGVSILDRGRAIKRPADGSVGKFGGYLNR